MKTINTLILAPILALIFALPAAAEKPAGSGKRHIPIFSEATASTDSRPSPETTAPAPENATETTVKKAAWAPRPERIDSMLMAVHGDGSVAAFERFFDDFIRLDTTVVLTSDTPDSVYQRRLRSILSPIGLPWNDVVKQYIVMYTTARRTTLGNILGRSQYYFPLIEQELAREGLPLELRMLAAIESALVPSARSRAGAVGLWQFMLPTARQYGLEITSFVDQRNDPVASTRAACRYLAFLYRTYNDWSLALAAYNCGPGNVNRALKMAGPNATNFWDVYNYLPSETRSYIPSFIAATYAYAYHKQHGIEIGESVLPLVVDTVMVRRLVHLEQVATTLEIPVETVRALNPQYLKDVVPALDKAYPLVLPLDQTTNFVGRFDDIHSKDSIWLAQYLNPANIDKTKKLLTATTSTTVYRVRKGDTLGHIAERHGVSVSQLMNWNNLKRNSTLSIGQRIRIQK